MLEATIENSDDHEIEEPVSPPACDPEEGRPMICVQSIEEIAREVVDENRAFNDIQCEEKKNSSQKNMEDAENCFKSKGFGKIIKSTDKLPSLIPATVSEVAEDLQTSPYKPPPTLHMSGGMVSTDMTLHMASHGIGVGERDGSIDNILQYFTLLHGDGVENSTEPDMQTQTTKMNDMSFLFTSTNPSHVCHTLPLDLSLSRKPVKVSLTGRGRGNRQREEWPDEGKMICTTKKYFDGSRTKSNEKKSFDIIHKGKELSQVNQDQDQVFAKRNKLLNDSQGVNQSAIETIKLGEEWEVTRENTLPEMSKTKIDEINCRLILPRNKEDKARIVFASGLYVEIDREVFINVEQNILGEKPEYQKNQSKRARNVASDSRSIRKKEVISRKRSEKQRNIVPAPNMNKTDSERKKDAKPVKEKCDKMPKDMPMIVTNGCLDDEEHKTSKQLQVVDKQLKTIQSFKNDKTPPPSPTSPPYPHGLHKLLSIVSKPSYYAKYENRELCKVKSILQD